MFRTGENAANAYRSFLYEVREMENLSTEGLIEAVGGWRTLRDSVYASIASDTSGKPHGNYENIVQAVHDSLQIEFTRLALSE